MELRPRFAVLTERQALDLARCSLTNSVLFVSGSFQLASQKTWWRRGGSCIDREKQVGSTSLVYGLVLTPHSDSRPGTKSVAIIDV